MRYIVKILLRIAILSKIHKVPFLNICNSIRIYYTSNKLNFAETSIKIGDAKGRLML